MKDFVTLVFEEGRVSTYGDVAKALGDLAASRTIGKILAENPRPIVVPCHRVVYSNGEVGWYGGKGKGAERKIDLLRREGVRVSNGVVEDFESVRFSDFRVTPILKELREEQERLSRRVISKDDFGTLRFVAGLDVSYSGDLAFASMAVYDWDANDIVERKTARSRADFPYITSYLAFREIPVLATLVRQRNDTVYLVDGHGVLHPRGFGIASHIGVAFDVPTVGAAKSLLSGRVESEDAAESPILLKGEVRGCRLGRGGRRLFVSTGSRVSLRSAVTVCRRFVDGHAPDPMREAHRLANEERRAATEDSDR